MRTAWDCIYIYIYIFSLSWQKWQPGGVGEGGIEGKGKGIYIYNIIYSMWRQKGRMRLGGFGGFNVRMVLLLLIPDRKKEREDLLATDLSSHMYVACVMERKKKWGGLGVVTRESLIC